MGGAPQAHDQVRREASSLPIFGRIAGAMRESAPIAQMTTIAGFSTTCSKAIACPRTPLALRLSTTAPTSLPAPAAVARPFPVASTRLALVARPSRGPDRPGHIRSRRAATTRAGQQSPRSHGRKILPSHDYCEARGRVGYVHSYPPPSADPAAMAWRPSLPCPCCYSLNSPSASRRSWSSIWIVAWVSPKSVFIASWALTSVARAWTMSATTR